jgi:hypothetical protein
VVDQFEAKKWSEGGSLELSTMALVADWEPATEARTRGRGGRRLVGELRGAALELGDGSVGSSEGPGAALHGGSTTVAWWRSGGRRAEEGERFLHGGRAPFTAGRGGGQRVARWRNRGEETVAGSRGRGKSVVATVWSGRCGPNAVGPWFGPASDGWA